MTQLVTAGFVQRPVIVGQQEQRSFVEVFPSPALVTLFPGQNRRGHIHCRALRYKYKKGRAWAEVHSEWEIYRARLRSLESGEPALKFSPEVRKQIAIDITEFKGRRYNNLTICWTGSSAPISRTTSGIGEKMDAGYWVIWRPDVSPCRGAAYRIARFTRMRCSPPLPRIESPSARSIAGRPCPA